MQPVAVTRFGLVSCLGAGVPATVSALWHGTSGLAPLAVDNENLRTYAGDIPDLDGFSLTGELAGFDCRNNRLAAMALEQDGFSDAVAAARERYGAHRIGLFVGTSTSGLRQSEFAYRRRDATSGALPADFDYARTHNFYSLGAFVRTRLGLTGPSFVVSAACASTAKVFGTASRMIAAGLCDAAVVGGADTLCGTTLHGFRSLNLLSEEPCRPFDVDRNGISIGEAAAFTLLQDARAIKDPETVRLVGVGESNDAFHMSTPHPEGTGARIAMEDALRAASLGPEQIDYINLHGTATLVGDAVEDHAVSKLFGSSVPCSSTKGYTGHTLGASGVLEAVFSCLSLCHGFIPGSPHTTTVDPDFKSRYVLQSIATRVDRVLTNSFGFGGVNCSLIFERAA